MRSFRGIVLVLCLLVGSTLAQELSDVVVVSEDELIQALATGDISYDQFLILQDIVINGIDSAQLFLLDEIPNLIYLAGTSPGLDPVEQAQTESVTAQTSPGHDRTVTGRVSYRFYQNLEDETERWNRTRLDLGLREAYRFRMQTAREKSGRERFTYRSLEYVSRSGVVRRMTLGNFTARLGLGTSVGYRGKLTKSSADLNSESLAYPDYGGLNGIMFETATGSIRTTSVASVTRDAGHQLSTLALGLSGDFSLVQPLVVFSCNTVVDRNTDRALKLPALTVGGSREYASGNFAAEITRQMKDRDGHAAVIEGRHRFQTAEIRYAGWSYSDAFLDLSAGSKSGQLYITDTMETVYFRYRTRRQDQNGLVLKTIVSLSESLQLSNGLLAAASGPNNNRHQFSTILTHRLGAGNRLIMSYLGRWRQRPDQTDRDASNRWRLEGQFKTNVVRARCYIDYTSESTDPDYVGLFLSVAYQANDRQSWQVWSNMGEIDSDGIEYWYLFVRGEWYLWEQISVAAKGSDSYRHSRANRHQPQLMLEVTARL